MLYPFSIKVREDRKLTRNLMFDLLVDHYEGSSVDQTQGMLAGPFGNPNRLEGGTGLTGSKVQMGRSISIPRTTTGLVGESFENPRRSIAWLSVDAPSTSMFVPLYQGK